MIPLVPKLAELPGEGKKSRNLKNQVMVRKRKEIMKLLCNRNINYKKIFLVWHTKITIFWRLPTWMARKEQHLLPWWMSDCSLFVFSNKASWEAYPSSSSSSSFDWWQRSTLENHYNKIQIPIKNQKTSKFNWKKIYILWLLFCKDACQIL